MPVRRLLFFFFILSGALRAVHAAEPVDRVAVLFDGPGWYFEELLAAVETETVSLTDRNVEFLVEARFNADWDSARIPHMLDAGLDEPDVDLVFAAGMLVAQEAARPERELSKPVLAGFPQDSGLSVFPKKQNFSYVLSRERVTRDVAKMRDLFDMDRLYCLVDEALAEHMDGVDELARRLSEQADMPVELLPVTGDPQAALDMVPDTATAVYITPLVRMDATARAELFGALADRGVRTFSILGAVDVELGALAGLTPDTRTRLARRLALNLIALLEGRSAESLPTEFSLPEQLFVNEETMRRADYRKPMGILLEARSIRGRTEEEPTGERLNVHDALARALTHNVQLDRVAADRAAAEQDRLAARSALFPQIDGQAGYREIDRDSAAASFGIEPRSRTTAGAQARQVLFNDQVFSRLRAATRGVSRADWETEEARLAVMETAAVRFFDALSARALLEVERDELERIRENLEFARLRVNIGETGREDALRWESEEARQLASMLAAEARWEAALAALNQALGEDPEVDWRLEAVELEDVETYFLDEELKFASGDADVVRALTGFWREWALRQSPALKALDEALAAKGMVADAERRSRFLPSVGVRAGYEHVIDRRTEGPDLVGGLAGLGMPVEGTDLPDDQWHVAVVADVPLFDGGQRRAAAARARAEVHRLEALRREAREQTEQAVVATYNQVMASQPAIRLSRQRVRAAQDSLQLIQDRYQQGAVGMLDLLDAQGRAFAAEQAAVIAVSRYLQDLARFQRAIAWFGWLQPDEERAALAAEMRAYLEDEP